MRNDPKIKTDGYTGFLAGIDSGITPNSIKANQVAFAYNVTFRNGWADSRPGFRLRPLDFQRNEARDWFEEHGFQGAGLYRENIVFSSGGRIFLTEVANHLNTYEITPWGVVTVTIAFVTPPIGDTITITVTDATPVEIGLPVFILDGYYSVTGTTATTVTMTNIDATPGLNAAIGANVQWLDANSTVLPFAWIIQANEWCVIQDGQSAAILFKDSASRRSNISQHEVPTGTVMAYGRGRLWVAINDSEFVAGDIVNGPTDVIQFTENIYINGGGAFSVPTEAGPIRAMIFMADLDTSYGQGPLQVFTERGIFSVNAPMERDQWQNVTNPIKTQTMFDYGAMSHNGTMLVNGDIFYRGRDGVRTLVMATRDFGTWGNTPISGEMDEILKDDDEIFLRAHSAVVFNNRMLFTVWPRPRNGFVYHGGIGVMDFKPLSGIGRQAPPIWEGVWGGINPIQIIKGVFAGVERCFAFVLNGIGENEFWEITKDDPFDNGDGRIESYFDSRSFIFESSFEAKKLTGMELWYDSIRGRVDFEVKYKPDQYPCWYDWQTWEECQLMRDCPPANPTVCTSPVEYRPGYRTRKSLPEPPSICEATNNKPSVIGYEFQVRLKWTGKARIKFVMAKAKEVEESPNGNLVC